MLSKKYIDEMNNITVSKERRGELLQAMNQYEYELNSEKTVVNVHEERRSGRRWARFAATGVAVAACVAFVVVSLSGILNAPNGPPPNAANNPTVSSAPGVQTEPPVVPENVTVKVLSATAVQAGDWIYYINEDDNGYIYRIKTDGTENTRLGEIRCDSFKIAGEWIYFNNPRLGLYGDFIGGNIYEDGPIYKMRLDGSDFTEIPVNHDGTFDIFGDSIYYVARDNDQNRAIYSANLDGTGETKLLQDLNLIFYFEINDGFIYYNISNYPESFSNTLYRIRLDGTENQKMFEDSCENILILDGWIYNEFRYVQGEEYLSVLKRINANTGEEQKIADGALGVQSFTVHNDSIYYMSRMWTDNYDFIYSIEKINMDGSGKTTLADDIDVGGWPYRTEINIVDDYIYFTDSDENGIYGLFRVSINGSEKQKVLLSGNAIDTNTSEFGGWIFYQGTGDGGTISRIREGEKNGTEIVKWAYVRSMQIVGDKVYYVPISNETGANSIWKCDLDGKNKELVYSKGEDDFLSFTISGGYIFINAEKGEGEGYWYDVIRTDLNGKNEIKMPIDYLDLYSEFNGLIVIDDWIYYKEYDQDDKYSLYKVSTDGKNKTQLTDTHDLSPHKFELYNNSLYYTLENGDFYKLDLSNDKSTRLFTLNAGSFAISNDVVYFSNEKDNGYLYKINLSGGKATKVRDHSVYTIVVSGDVIYYIYNTDVYRINTDGSGNKRLAEGTWYFQFIPD